MAIKFNITQQKMNPAGAVIGKKTLDSMILDKINNYAPASVSYGYSAMQAAGARGVEGEEYDVADLEQLLQRDRLHAEADNAQAIDAQEVSAPEQMFQEFGSPEQSQIEEQPVQEGWMFEGFDKLEEEAAIEAPMLDALDKIEEQAEHDVPLLDKLEKQLAQEAPLFDGVSKEEEEVVAEEPVFEGMKAFEQEIIAATPDPEAPQAHFEEAELSPACPNVMRTRRGTIAFVRHDVGTYINPIYNKCGMLVRVDLNGITLCRKAANQDWMVVDTEGNDIIPSGLSSVYFDRQGNLITVTKEGKKVTIGLDGTTHNS
jgi:hypothetical protein